MIPRPFQHPSTGSGTELNGEVPEPVEGPGGARAEVTSGFVSMFRQAQEPRSMGRPLSLSKGRGARAEVTSGFVSTSSTNLGVGKPLRLRILKGVEMGGGGDVEKREEGRTLPTSASPPSLQRGCFWELSTRRSRRRFFLVTPPFEPGAGSVEAGLHPLDSRFRGNDDRVAPSSMIPILFRRSFRRRRGAVAAAARGLHDEDVARPDLGFGVAGERLDAAVGALDRVAAAGARAAAR